MCSDDCATNYPSRSQKRIEQALKTAERKRGEFLTLVNLAKSLGGGGQQINR